jgi:hypothetical protein
MYGHETKHYHMDDDDDNDDDDHDDDHDHDDLPPTHYYDHPNTPFIPISHHTEEAMPTTLHYEDD